MTEYQGKIDENCELKIPENLQKYLTELDSLDSYLVPLRKGVFRLCSPGDVSKISKAYKKQIIKGPNSLDKERLFHNEIAKTKIYTNGNISIEPELMIEHFPKKEVTIVEAEGDIEIWNRKTYEDFREEQTQIFLDLARAC